MTDATEFYSETDPEDEQGPQAVWHAIASGGWASLRDVQRLCRWVGMSEAAEGEMEGKEDYVAWLEGRAEWLEDCFAREARSYAVAVEASAAAVAVLYACLQKGEWHYLHEDTWRVLPISEADVVAIERAYHSRARCYRTADIALRTFNPTGEVHTFDFEEMTLSNELTMRPRAIRRWLAVVESPHAVGEGQCLGWQYNWRGRWEPFGVLDATMIEGAFESRDSKPDQIWETRSVGQNTFNARGALFTFDFQTMTLTDEEHKIPRMIRRCEEDIVQIEAIPPTAAPSADANWQYVNEEEGSWWPFSEADVAILEHAYQGPDKVVRSRLLGMDTFNDAGDLYTVDLMAMRATNEFTARPHMIRRRGYDVPQCPPAVIEAVLSVPAGYMWVWEYVASSGHWTEFSEVDATIIQRLVCDNQPTNFIGAESFNRAGQCFTFDFDLMILSNEEYGRPRAIRRRMRPIQDPHAPPPRVPSPTSPLAATHSHVQAQHTRPPPPPTPAVLPPQHTSPPAAACQRNDFSAMYDFLSRGENTGLSAKEEGTLGVFVREETTGEVSWCDVHANATVGDLLVKVMQRERCRGYLKFQGWRMDIYMPLADSGLSQEVTLSFMPLRLSRERKAKLAYDLREAISSHDLERAAALLAEGAEPDLSDGLYAPPLFLAAENGELDMMQLLLHAGADINLAHRRITSTWTVLHEAAYWGRTSVVNFLCKRRGIAPNHKDSEGWTALHYAVKQCHVGVTQTLCDPEHGALIDEETKDGYTPWGLTETGYGDPPTREALRAARYRVRRDGECTQGRTPLHVAAGNGRRGEIDAVCLRDASVPDKYGNVPMHIAVWSGHADIVALLCTKSETPLDVRNEEGYTPLHLAAERGYVQIVAALCRHGAEVNRKDATGRTALDMVGDDDTAAHADDDKATTIQSVLKRFGGKHRSELKGDEEYLAAGRSGVEPLRPLRFGAAVFGTRRHCKEAMQRGFAVTPSPDSVVF